MPIFVNEGGGENRSFAHMTARGSNVSRKEKPRRA